MAAPLPSENRRWYRICLQREEDIQYGFELLLDFVAHPERADSVQELVFNIEPESRRNGPPTGTSAGLDSDHTINIDNREEIRQGLFDLVDAWPLPEALRMVLGKSLAWKTYRQDPTDVNPASGNWNDRYVNVTESCSDEEALMISLACVCSNLEILRTRIPYKFRPTGRGRPPPLTVTDRPIYNFLHAVSHQEAGLLLSKLQHVELIPCQLDPEYREDEFYHIANTLDSFSCIYQLPSILTFTVRAASRGLDDEPDLRVIPPGLSTITELSLLDSDLTSARIAALVRAPQKLRKVHISIGDFATWDKSYSPVYPKTLGKALSQHSQSLEYVDVDVDNVLHQDIMLHVKELEDFGALDRHARGLAQELASHRERHPFFAKDEQESIARGYPLLTCDIPDDKMYKHTIGSFADFKNLRTLKIGVKTLLGDRDEYGPRSGALEEPPAPLEEMLPSSLRYLTIRGYKKGENPIHDRLVDQFLSRRAEALPLLEEVVGLDAETFVPCARELTKYVETGTNLTRWRRGQDSNHLVNDRPQFDWLTEERWLEQQLAQQVQSACWETDE